jgi:alpha-glucosidase (family GH31 glycosyl hydrolase)
MKTISLAGGRVSLTFDEALAYTQHSETLAVPYATEASIAPVTAAACTWRESAGRALTVTITLPAPVCGLGECVGLPFWFSRGHPRPLMTTDWNGATAPDAGLCVQEGVLFSGAGVAVIPHSDGLHIELATVGDVATYTLTATADLAVTIFDGPHLRAVQTAFARRVGWPAEVPALLEAPVIYTTWAHYKTAVTQDAVLDLAAQIDKHGFPTGIIEIDDRWQTAYGDLTFDAAKFPDPGALLAHLKAAGFDVTLWVPPFVNPDAALWSEAEAAGVLVHDAAGQPLLTTWWQGEGGLIDAGNPAALAWWAARLHALRDGWGLAGLKYDGGEGNFLPSGAATPVSPNGYSARYVEFAAAQPGLNEVRTAYWSQRAPITLRVFDLFSTWGLDNGLAALPVRLLTLGMLGYPFVLPDMIGGNQYGTQRCTGEMLVRWTQATAFTLSMQFGILPWTFLAPTPGICKAYTWLHLALKDWLLDYARRVTCQNGYPVLRPLGLDYPTDSQALACADQWLLGDRLLVAPVLGQPRGRAVYLPVGRWYDPWTGQYVDGPKRLDIHVPLHICPFFILTEDDDDPWAAFPGAEHIVGQIKKMMG